MGFIELEGMEFYAFHGHFREEQVVGNRFVVDLKIETDTKPAEKSDQLGDALDYQHVYHIIAEEMKQKSFLLENIAARLCDKLTASFPQISYMTLKVSKINPPLGGKVKQVSVCLNYQQGHEK
jgi:dihydroneopterin aldolase